MSASRPMASSQETKFKAKFAAQFIDCLKERGVEAEIEPFPFHWVWEVQRRETGPVQLSMAFKGIYQRGEDVSHLCRAEIPDGWLCARRCGCSNRRAQRSHIRFYLSKVRQVRQQSGWGGLLLLSALPLIRCAPTHHKKCRRFSPAALSSQS